MEKVFQRFCFELFLTGKTVFDRKVFIDLLDKSLKTCITIPMTNEARSLNIANSVSIVAYEALRQNFKDFK